jgi:hypothetical protein
LSQETVDQYSAGACMVFAAAVHRLIGAPLEADVCHVSGFTDIDHAWVILPDGRAFDVNGPAPAASMPSGFPDIEHVRLRDEEHLKSYVDARFQATWDLRVASAITLLRAHWAWPALTPRRRRPSP